MMIFTMTIISNIMRPMTMIMTTEEPMSYLMMTRKIVATMMTDMVIVLLSTNEAHPKMDPMLLLLLMIIMRTALLTAIDHPTMAD